LAQEPTFVRIAEASFFQGGTDMAAVRQMGLGKLSGIFFAVRELWRDRMATSLV
jgi:hypothetical protein